MTSQLLINNETITVLGAQGPQGATGATGSSNAFYVHNQNTPSASWVINHNLGAYPTAVVMDSAHTQVEGDFSYTNSNQLVITFSSAFSGIAYVI